MSERDEAVTLEHIRRRVTALQRSLAVESSNLLYEIERLQEALKERQK